MKRIVSIFLVMILSLMYVCGTVNAFAESENSSITYTIDRVPVEYEQYGIVKAFLGSTCIWTYTTDMATRTELETISDVYSHDNTAYIVVNGALHALNASDGKEKWKINDVGASNSCVFDANGNIYISGFYGPNFKVISENGNVLYEENIEDYYWVYDLKIHENTLYIYYDSEIGGVKTFDISQFNVSQENKVILNGDFSEFAGKYNNQAGEEMILFNNGLDEWSNENDNFEYKVTEVTKLADGSYTWGIIPYYNGEVYGGYGIILYPKEVDVIAYDGSIIQTDTSKIRLWRGNGSVSDAQHIYYKQNDTASNEIEFVLDVKTENIDLDYLTKYYWYYDCGNYVRYQFKKDGTYILFDHEGNINKSEGKYSLENNILTFHDEWGDSSWHYINNSLYNNWESLNKDEKIFYALDSEYEYIGNTYEEVPVEEEIKVVLNGEEIEFDQPPINTPEGRLLVPIRKIAESMDKIVLYSEETKTAFIDNSDNALIIPLFEKTMYLANENGFNSWEKVELDVPAIETNGRTLVPVRAFCESLGATVIWEDETKTAFITYDNSIVSERMNDMLFDSINLVWYMERLDALWSTKEFPFDDYSVVIDDFYINRPYGVDAINMGLSDPFAGIQDLISMTNGSDNATNIILQSMQEILSEVPSGTDLNFDAGIVKTLKEMVASGVDIYSEVGGLGYKLRSYSDAFVFLDDAMLDYSKNYHSTVSGIFDLSVFTLEELAYLLTEYQTNVEYLDIFENKLKEAGYSDETIEKSVSLLRTQYTNKFIGVMLDLRSACVEASVGAVLNAELTIAGQSTWGVGVGMLVWKGIFGITGINKQGEALKIFYGLYCIDNRLNSTFNDVISVHESLTSSELLELRRLIELLKAEKITAYKAMKNITWDKDSKNEADKQIEEIQQFTYRIFK